MKYNPELDGLRGLAIASVMAFHLGLFPLGWVGVPLFFVLSGYLITSILTSARQNTLKEYLGKFYWRRTLRIFPLYYVYLFVNAALCLGAGLSIEGYGWFVAYLGNHQIGNLAPNVPGGFIGHLWSLAVEEQFYLIWPLVVFYVRRLWIVALLAVLVAPLFREAILQTTGNPYLAILTLPSCIDMLAAGALVSIVKDRRFLMGMPELALLYVFGVFGKFPSLTSSVRRFGCQRRISSIPAWR